MTGKSFNRDQGRADPLAGDTAAAFGLGLTIGAAIGTLATGRAVCLGMFGGTRVLLMA
jgi:hypothetical protein